MNVDDFNKRMVLLQFMSNYVMHNDSLEVLSRYTYRENKKFETSSDRQKHQKMIRELSMIKE